MIGKVTKVLKNNQVVVDGSVKLGLGVCCVAASGDGLANKVQSVAQEARIIESNSEYAVIEIICSCGGKNHIQCNYAELAASGS